MRRLEVKYKKDQEHKNTGLKESSLGLRGDRGRLCLAQRQIGMRRLRDNKEGTRLNENDRE